MTGLSQGLISQTISNITVTTLAGGRFSGQSVLQEPLWVLISVTEWFITEDDKVSNSSGSAWKAACTISLGSMAWNSLFSMLVNLLAAIVGGLCSASERPASVSTDRIGTC